jgi:hypothetical protein
MPDVWPTGTDFVLLDGAVRALSLPTPYGSERIYRFGPAEKPYGDGSYRQQRVLFSGSGLRPYRPVHMRMATVGNGGFAFSWIRRTRVEGDCWEGMEVPLAEEREAYLVTVSHDGEVLRQIVVNAPFHTYSRAEQIADGSGWPRRVEVAQISARFGPGPSLGITIDV